MALVWQSVFLESRMISDILPENGFPRQCAHWLGMTGRLNSYKKVSNWEPSPAELPGKDVLS